MTSNPFLAGVMMHSLCATGVVIGLVAMIGLHEFFGYLDFITEL
jgi:hypothetical protein